MLPVYPEMKQIVDASCKNNIPYFTFIAPIAVNSIKMYLKERERKHGSLQDDQVLFMTESGQVEREQRPFTPLSKDVISENVKASAHNANLERWKNVYPHVLRKAFEERLRSARLDPKDQEFLMGHILSMIK